MSVFETELKQCLQKK